MARKRGKASADLEGPPENCSAEDEASHVRWMWLALALGFNLLAKDHAPDLGAKVYFRLRRDGAVRDLIAAGGNGGVSPFAVDDEILELEVPDRMPRIAFRSADIELMRLEVARHDVRAAEKKALSSPKRSGT